MAGHAPLPKSERAELEARFDACLAAQAEPPAATAAAALRGRSWNLERERSVRPLLDGAYR